MRRVLTEAWDRFVIWVGVILFLVVMTLYNAFLLFLLLLVTPLAFFKGNTFVEAVDYLSKALPETPELKD